MHLIRTCAYIIICGRWNIIRDVTTVWVRHSEPRCHLCIHISHYPRPNANPNSCRNSRPVPLLHWYVCVCCVCVVFVVIGTCIALQLGYTPRFMVFECLATMFLFYAAHWQAYCSGLLKFGLWVSAVYSAVLYDSYEYNLAFVTLWITTVGFLTSQRIAWLWFLVLWQVDTAAVYPHAGPAM